MNQKISALKEKITSFFIKTKRDLTKNKKVAISILIVILIVLIALVIMLIPEKETNLSGNLSNLGFTVSSGKTTYYLGYKDGTTDGIYKIKGKETEKIIDDYGYYLNKYKNCIYYLDSNNDIIKITTNGKNREVLVKNVDTQAITVSKGYVFYFSNSNFYRVKTNGKDKKVILNKSIDSYQIIGNWIYYTYVDNGNFAIGKIKTNGEDNKKIDSNCGKAFWVNGNYIYYIYENINEENFALTYELYKMKKDGSKKEKIAEIDGIIDRSTVNFYKDFVYYVKRTEDGEDSIYRIKLNGEDEIKIVDIVGFSTRINVNDKWLYYPDESKNGDIEIFRINLTDNDKQSI